MRIIPMVVVADLEGYIDLFGVELSQEARRTIAEVESFCCQCNNPSTYEVYLSKLIKQVPMLREKTRGRGYNPDFCSLILEKDYYTRINVLEKYNDEARLYSRVEKRHLADNTYIIDCALDFCICDGRTSISNEDLLLGLLDAYEKQLGQAHGTWTDSMLNTGYLALFHILGKYNDALNIKFDEIRSDLRKGSLIDYHSGKVS